MDNFKCCGKGCDMHHENMRKMKVYNGRREIAAIGIGFVLLAVSLYVVSLV